MPYPELLALIDAKITRMRYARELLTTSALPEILIDLEKHLQVLVQQAEAETQKASVEPIVAVEAVQKIRQILPRFRRERRVVARAKHVEPTALRGPLPTGPVFVPAIRLITTEKSASPVSAGPFEKPSDMPTAAQLTQRWLHASS